MKTTEALTPEELKIYTDEFFEHMDAKHEKILSNTDESEE